MRKKSKSSKKSYVEHSPFEVLESRQMMSVVNVSPGSNIQAAINSSSAGDTVSFAPGTYNLSSSLQLPGNRTYQGNGAVLNWVGAADFAAKINGDSTTVTGFTFNGSGIDIHDGANQVTISNCTVQNSAFSSWPADSAVFYNGLTNSSVNHCTFEHWSGQSCIFGYNSITSHFDDNSFQDVWHGMHLNWGTPQLSNTTILRNTFSEVRRFALELQGEVNGLDVGYNWAANFDPADHATLAFSIPLAAETSDGSVIYSHNIHVHNNYAGGNGLIPLYTGNGDQSWGFELGGADTVFDHNVVNGPFFAGIVDGKSTPAWSYHDNVFAGLQGAAAANEDKGVMPAAGNVYNNQVLANMIATPTPQQITSGSYWGVNSGGTGTPIVTQSPTPTPAPSPTPTPNPAGITATPLGGGKIRYTLVTPLTAATNLTIKSTQGSDPWQSLGTLPAGTTTFTVSGINAQWEVLVKVGNMDPMNVRNTLDGPDPMGSFNPVLNPTVAPAPTPTPAPTPAPTPTPASAGITGTALGGGQIQYTLATPLTAATVLQIKSTQGSDAWQSLGTLPAGTTTFTISGINAQWEVLVKVGDSDPYNLRNTLDGPDPMGSFNPVLNPTVTPAPTPTPAPTSAPASAGITGTALGDGQIQYTLATPLTAATVLQIKSTQGSDAWQNLGTLPAGTTTFTISGINAQWEVLVKVGDSDPYNLRNTLDGPDPMGSFNPVLTVPAGASIGITGTPLGGGEIQYKLITPLTTATEVQIKSTRGSDAWQSLGTLPAGTTTFTVGGINAAWEVLVKVGDNDPYNLRNTLNGPDSMGAFNPVLVTPSLPATAELTADPIGGGKIQYTLADPLAAPAVLKIKSTQGSDPWQTLGTLPAGTSRFTVGGINAIWEVLVEVGDSTPINQRNTLDGASPLGPFNPVLVTLAKAA